MIISPPMFLIQVYLMTTTEQMTVSSQTAEISKAKVNIKPCKSKVVIRITNGIAETDPYACSSGQKYFV